MRRKNSNEVKDFIETFSLSNSFIVNTVWNKHYFSYDVVSALSSVLYKLTHKNITQYQESHDFLSKLWLQIS